ncbi:uncharacterized protein EMH_0055940 [Eimeria mitis]|uniref:50S ribosomal protein L35 n=1 Tax=Eimeria mitis TaxID=44415 RepID=U6KKN4_9EIME|nr:uncharacterized protein EMH_0055940 [Eimeria mitis]CDJ36018.1 hypothetical protein, conserved [Eimeria mitis]
MDCQSETETAVVKFPLGTDSAEGPGKTSFAAKPQQELVNRETYYQYLAKRSVDSAAGGDASGTSSSWAVQIPPLRKSSIGAVSSTSALRMCLATPLPGSPTTNWRVGANLTGSDIAAADTLPPLSTAEGRKGSKEVNSPAELSTVCSSDGCTAVERFRPSLPRTVPGVPPATGVTEGSSDACSSSLAATEKYSHAQQSQSFTPSITTAGVTSSDACSTVSHEDRTQVSRYEYVTSQVARLDLLEASGATIIPKQMCGLPPAEVQPQQCSPLSSATCSETQEEQTSDQMKGETLGTALAHLQKQEQSYSGSSHVSALRTASQGSTELSRDAVKGNRNCIRCLEGPTQKKQPRGELPLASYFSDGSAFLSVAGAGKGVGIRRSSTLGRRPTDFTEINIRGSPIPIQSTARRVENVRAMSSSCIYKTQRPSSSAEGKRLFKGAQRRTPTSAVQAGHLFGRSRRLRLREPKLTAQALLPHPRSKVEVHVQQPKASSFLAERRTAVPPSCKTQDPTGTSRGHAIAIHSAAPAFSRAVSLHSRNHGLPSHKTNNERSWAALDDMEAKCCDNSRTSTKVQNWGKDEGPSRVQDVSLPFPSASSRTPQMRDEGMQSEPGIVQTRGRVACSGSGKPRRAVGRLLPLFLLATAVNVALCSRAPSSADLDPEVMLPGYWVTPQTSRVYHVRRVGRNDGSSAFAIDGSLTACGGRGILDSVLQRSGLQDRRAAASSAAQQKVAWLQPLYCKASQAAKTSCLPGKGQRGKSFCSAASGLLFTASHPKHPVHVAQFDPSLSGAPYNLSMRRAVRVAAVKQKSRGSIDKRFKITATGKLLYKRPGLQHHAHTKSSARRTRLRRVAALKPSQISRLLGPLRVRR